MIRKVFIVDDDEISIFILESFLMTEGFAEEFVGFLDAEEALQVLLDAADEDLPEIIFLDLNMPVLSGWDFLDALQPYEDKLLGKCSIYILTSSVDPAEIKRARDYKLVVDYLHKPLTEEAIEKIVKQNARLKNI
ncbi:response regulator [Botryobacter ruber]|uniref:response regulator n=1 Tax=Botryobacter ruber TaxID=2171629 RepID=UPI000E0A8E87|nr:response regulator [Botryobacter ruber]